MHLQRWAPWPTLARSSTLAVAVAVAMFAGSGSVSAVEAMSAPTGRSGADRGPGPSSERTAVVLDSIAPRVEWQTPHQAFSPDGDGFEDTLTAEFRLSEPATGAVVVLDANEARVATLTATQATAPQSEPAPIIIRAIWDGMADGVEGAGAGPAAPGRYRVRATFTDRYGNAVSTEMETEVLNVSPGEIASPDPGAGEAGRTVFAVAVSGHDGIAVDAVLFWPLGIDGPVRDGVAASVEDGRWRASADLAALIDRGVVSEGDSVMAEAFVYWTDRFGKMHTHRTRPVAYRVEAEVAELVVVDQSPDRQFSPNGDGAEDSIDAVAEFSLPVAVTATVRDNSGALVRRLAAAAGQSVRVAWDGKDASGAPAPEGEYRLRIEGTRADGASAVAVMRVAIDRRAPATIRSPIAGSTIAGLAPLVLSETPGFELQTVHFRPFGSEAATYTVSQPEPDGTWTLPLATSRFADGSLYLEPEVHWRDRFGQHHRSTLPRTEFVVNNAGAKPAALLSVSPSRSFSPNGDRFEDRFAALFSLSERVSASVVVVDESGNVVRGLDGRWLDDSMLETVWDGIDDAGRPAPSGRYRIRLDAVDRFGYQLNGTVETEVLYRLPGRLVAPVSGPVEDDRFQVVVAPTNGTDLSSVSVTPFGLDLTHSDIDGRWTGEMRTGELADGRYWVMATLRWLDRFGSEHVYNTPVANIQVTAPEPTENASPTVSFSPVEGDRHVRYGDSISPLSVSAADSDGDRIELALLEPVIAGIELGSGSCEVHDGSSRCAAGLSGFVDVGHGEYRLLASARDGQGGVGRAAYDLHVSPRPVEIVAGPISYTSQRQLSFTLELTATAGDLANADVAVGIGGDSAPVVSCSAEPDDGARLHLLLTCSAAEVASGAGTIVVTANNEFFSGLAEVGFDLALPEAPLCERTVVRFDDYRLLNTDDSSATGLQSLSLGCSRYQMRLEGRDELHQAGYQTDQVGEQWFLEAYDAAGNVIYRSPRTEDLADDETYAVLIVASVDLTGVVAVRARHYRGTNSIDSIDPRLVLLPSTDEAPVSQPQRWLRAPPLA